MPDLHLLFVTLWQPTLLGFVPAAGFSALLVWLAARRRLSRRAFDTPGHRSLHVTPVPRLGGVGIMLPILVLLAGSGSADFRVLSGSLLAVCTISLVDDLCGVRARLRLAFHVTAALAVCAATDQAPVWLAVLAVPTLVWMANLFNFMDGADGLAGGMALIGFGALSIAGTGHPALQAVCAAVAGGAAGFLCFNFAPARVFLGDVGSVPLGFLAGALGFTGFVAGAWPWWFAPLVFAPFILDASVTVARRAWRGANLMEAHREHLYQQLILAGWSHRRLAISAWALMLGTASCSLLAQTLPGPASAAAAGSGALLLVTAYVVALRHLAAAHKAVNNPHSGN